MEWNRRVANLAPATSQNQQCLLLPTASTVMNVQSQSGGSGQQNAYVPANPYGFKGQILPTLLNASTPEETLKATHAALIGHLRNQPKKHSSRGSVSRSQYSSSYKPVQETKKDAFVVQNPIGSNFRMPYAVQQTQPPQQQQPVQAMQQYSANGYNASVNGYNANVVQQQVQNTQVLQNYQPSVTYTYSQPAQNVYTTSRQAANTVQTSCSQMAAKGPATALYDILNAVPAQYQASQKATEANVSSSAPVYRNNQTITNAAVGNYRLSHFNGVPQPDGNVNGYVQSPQRTMLQNAFVPDSSQLLATSVPATKMPPSYTQAAANMFVSQNFTSQSQTYGVPNAQLPAQANTALPVQNSAAGEPAQINQMSSPDRKRDLLKLLLGYRNFRHNYELLNRENNLLRERLRANSSLENANPPPLISSLPNLSNVAGAEQQNLSQALPVQSSPQTANLNGFQSQNVCANMANAATQQSKQGFTYPKDNPLLSNQMCKSESTKHCRQTNYSVFDGGQKGIGSDSNSNLQSLANEHLTKIYQGLSQSPMVPSNTTNQYVSSSNNGNDNLPQNTLGVQSLNTSTSEMSTPVYPEQKNNEYLPYCTPASREAIEASLPLWKSVPQSSIQNNTVSSEPQNQQPVVGLTDNTINLLDEITFAPTNEVPSVLPGQKPDSVIPNQAKAQIAIVSPLVQTKESLHENYQLPKAQILGSEAENATVNGLTNPRESDCLQKILEVLESIEANTMNNSKTSKSKSHQDESLDVASLASSTEPSPQAELEQKPSQDIEIIDDSLQISGICTLVEGNSFYDSSVAMMFGSEKENQSQNPNAACITSSKADAVEIKTEPPDDYEAGTEQKSEDSVHSAKTPDFNVQEDQSIETSELKSSTVSDQLSELLTEFPYGIKNYMSEIKLDDIDEPFGQLTDSPRFNMASVPTKEFESVIEDHSGSCMDLQTESLPRPSPELQVATEEAYLSVMDFETDEKPPIDLLETSHSISVPLMDADSDDYCEIISDSPVGGIHITLLDQEEITKIFPDEHGKSVSEICSNIKIENEELAISNTSSNIKLENKELAVSDSSSSIKRENEEPATDVHNVELNSHGSHKGECTSSESLKVHFNSHGDLKVEFASPESRKVEFASPESRKVEFASPESRKVEFASPESRKVEFASPESENTNENVADVPNQASFCCLFSWLTSTNVDAPKCDCKKESPKGDTKDDHHTSHSSSKAGFSPQSPEPITPLNTSPSPEIFEPRFLNVGNPKVTDLKEHGVVQSIDKPPKLDMIVPNAEIIHPMDKPPTLEPVTKAQPVQKFSHSMSNQVKSPLKRSISLESIRSPKEFSVKSISSSLGHEHKKHKDHHFSSKRRKSDGSQKIEKLVVKTDFLKNNHCHKPRKEDSSQSVTRDKNFFQNVFSKSSEEAEKRLQGDNVGYRKGPEHPSSQQSAKDLIRPKPFLAVDKSRHHHRGRRRKEKESHFEKNRKVPSVHEYLERKRELCNKRSETRKDPNEGMSNVTQMVVERPSTDENKSGNLKRPIFNVKSYVSKTRDVQDKSPKFSQSSKDYKASSSSYDSSHRKHKSGRRHESVNKSQDVNSSYSKGTIYLSPCVGTKPHSDEQINLVKLQIRRSPEKPKDVERRKSVESFSNAVPSNVANKNSQSPKMLEFKLYPEFAQAGSPAAQDQSQEAKDLQAKSVVEGIKSSKEAWCNAMPLKKRRVDSTDSQGMDISPTSTKSPPAYKPLERNAARPAQDSQTTFNLFRQLYHEQRSKWLDTSLGHS